MPIELYTGLPGNGKTAFAMERLLAESKKGERPIFAAGIEGLAPGHATTLDDPKLWNAKDANGVHLVPDGALIFVDEAWKWFGHLHDASRQATPAHVLALAEHRHRGIDFVWTTQQPNQLYPFTRGLIARHTHVVRRFGTHMVELFAWEELNEDVKSVTKRENSMRSTRMLPKEVFEQYKSATLHTIKRRLPLKLFVLPVAIIGAIVAGWFAYQMLKPKDKDATAITEAADPGEAGTAPESAGHAKAEPLTLEQYLDRLKPRVATMPWSAPAFDEREVASEPDLICAESGAGEDALGQHRASSCTCLTEQGTPYAIEDAICRMTAKQGRPYNPFKEPSRQNGRGSGGRQDGRERATETAPNVSVIEADQISGYGDLGARDLTSAP